MAGSCIGKEELSAYLDGEVKSPRNFEIQSHLDECSQCLNEHQSLKALSSLFKRGPASESLPVPDLWESLSNKLLSTCQAIQEDLSAYLDGELPLAAQEGINEHLKDCNLCCEQFKNLNATNQLIARGLELPNTVEIDIWSNVHSRLDQDCALIRSELSVYIDQEVAALRHRTVTAHLLECPACQKEFRNLTIVGDLLRLHYQPQQIEQLNLWPAIKAKLQVVPLATRRRSNVRLMPKRLAVAAVAAVVAGLVGSTTFYLNFGHGRVIRPVSAEAYLLESAMMEPAESAEAIVYENQ